MKKVVSIIIITILIASISCCTACTSDKTEYEISEVVSCAKNLKNMMKDPESFEIYGTCEYQEGYLKDTETVYICLPYRAKNSFGAYITEVAYYVNGSYIGDNSDYNSCYNQWSDSRKSTYLKARIVYLESKFTKSYSKDEVNKELKRNKIISKM